MVNGIPKLSIRFVEKNVFDFAIPASCLEYKDKFVQEHAKSAGATYKMGNKVLVNVDIFEAYLEQFRIPGECESMARKFVPDMASMYR